MMEIDREQMKEKIENAYEKKWAQDAEAEEGKMHELLGVPKDEQIEDEYDSGQALAKDLLDKVDQDEASSMLAYAANLTGKQLFKDALEYIKEEVPNE